MALRKWGVWGGGVGVVGLVELVGLVWRKKPNVNPPKKKKNFGTTRPALLVKFFSFQTAPKELEMHLYRSSFILV